MGNLEIGKRIEARRNQLGLTLNDVASQIGVAKSTIQRYEKGVIRKIKMPVIEAIARILEVDPAWICGKTSDMHSATHIPENRLSTEAKEVAKAYDQATKKEQSTVRFVLSDYLQDTASPRELAARTSGEPIKDDPSTFIIEGEDPDLP